MTTTQQIQQNCKASSCLHCKQSRLRTQLTRIVATIAAVWLLGTVAGCERSPAPGGATNRKAEQSRRQAMQLAETAFRGAVESRLRSQSNEKGRNRLEHLWQKTRQMLGLPTTSDRTTQQEMPLLSALDPPVEVPAPPPRDRALRPKAQPRPGPPPVIRERIVSRVPRPTEADAEEDALEVAAELIAQRFAELDPPLDYQPSPEEIRQYYLRRDSREVIPFGQRRRQQQDDPRIQQLLPLLESVATPTEIDQLVDVEFDLEVTAEQIRRLRSQERAITAFYTVAILACVFFVLYVLFYIDEKTKGYLTRWLFLAGLPLFLLSVLLLVWYYAIS